MNTDRLQGGMKHAPGVLCIVQVPATHRHPAGNHGKLVTITKRLQVGNRYRCGCGDSVTLPDYGASETLWEVTGAGLWCNVPTPFRPFLQSWLIPLGDSSLVKGEKWEATNPKEDKIERAQVLVHRFREAYPDIATKWKEFQI